MNTANPYSKALPFIALFLVGIIYLLTLPPSVIETDSGELAAALYHLGLPHATGYPLFSILGWLFLQIPTGLRPIVQLHVLGALFTLGGVYFLSVSVNCWLVLKGGFTIQTANIVQSVFCLVAGTLPVVWKQATGIEVYSLHILLIAFVFYRLILWSESNTLQTRIWLGVAIGLSFSNHASTIMLAPGILVLYFALSNKSFSDAVKDGLGIALIAFAVLGIFWTYLILRANQYPLINWGNPTDYQSFTYHVLGKQYSNFIGGKGVFAKQFALFFKIGWPFIVLIGGVASVGLFKLSGKLKIWTIVLIINTVTCLIIACNYNIHDIESYFLLAFLSLAILFCFGITQAIEQDGVIKKLGYIYPIAAAVIAIGLIILNWKQQDISKLTAYETYTLNILEQVEPNALIYSRQWDTFVAPALYFQYVEGKGKNVLVIDKELVRRSWYYNQLKNFDAKAIAPVKTEYEAFLKVLKPFELGKPFDGQAIETAWRTLHAAILAKSMAVRPIYVTPDLLSDFQSGELQLPKGYSLIPVGNLFKVVTDNQAYTPNFSYPNIAYPKRKTNKLIDQMKDIQILTLGYRATYEKAQGKPELAQKIMAQADSLSQLK
jgi:hypothetical protein